MKRTKSQLCDEKVVKKLLDFSSGGTGMEIYREFTKFHENFPNMSKVQILPEFKKCFQ